MLKRVMRVIVVVCLAFSMANLQVYATMTNIAQGKPTWAAGQGTGHPISYATDGDDSTYWNPVSHTLRLYVNLGDQPVEYNKIVIKYNNVNPYTNMYRVRSVPTLANAPTQTEVNKTVAFTGTSIFEVADKAPPQTVTRSFDKMSAQFLKLENTVSDSSGSAYTTVYDFKVFLAVPSSLRLDGGSRYGIIPTAGTNVVQAPQPTVLDEAGDKIEDSTYTGVSWSLVGGPTGVQIDSSTGALAIDNTAVEGDVNIKCTLTTSGYTNISQQYTIRLVGSSTNMFFYNSESSPISSLTRNSRVYVDYLNFPIPADGVANTIVALYDSTGQLETLDIKQHSDVTANKVLTGDLMLPDKNLSGYSLKAFLWNDMSKMIPIVNDSKLPR